MDSENLYRQNDDQYAKIHCNTAAIAKLEARLEALKVDIVGVTGNNGLRGEFRQYRDKSEQREQQILDMIAAGEQRRELAKKEAEARRHSDQRWRLGIAASAIFGAPSAMVAILRIMGVL